MKKNNFLLSDFFSEYAEVPELFKSSRNGQKFGFPKRGGGTLYLFGKWPIVAYFYGQIGLFPSEKPGNPAIAIH